MAITLSLIKDDGTAGVEEIPASIPTTEMCQWVEKNIDPYDIALWSDRATPGIGFSSVTRPPGFRPSGPVRIGELRWPQRASKWAYMHIMMEADQLNRIHDAAFGNDGSTSYHVMLSIDSPLTPSGKVDTEGVSTDRKPERLDAPMWVLPPYPLSAVNTGDFQATPGSGLVPPADDDKTSSPYLVTLVDDRYFWWGVPFHPFSPPIDGSVTWAELIQRLADSLNEYDFEIGGGTFPTDDIKTEYLNPSPSFNLPHKPVPPMIDAVAANIGMRFVRQYDGKCSFQRPEKAQEKMAADFAKNPDRTLIAGGDRLAQKLPYP